MHTRRAHDAHHVLVSHTTLNRDLLQHCCPASTHRYFQLLRGIQHRATFFRADRIASPSTSLRLPLSTTNLEQGSYLKGFKVGGSDMLRVLTECFVFEMRHVPCDGTDDMRHTLSDFKKCSFNLVIIRRGIRHHEF